MYFITCITPHRWCNGQRVQ